MKNKKEYCNKCSVCKTEYPLENKNKICPLCNGEIIFNIEKRTPFIKKILFDKFNFTIKTKPKDIFYITTDKDGKKTYHTKTNMNLNKKNININFNLAKIILIVSSILMAFNNIEGWGWVLFLSFLID